MDTFVDLFSQEVNIITNIQYWSCYQGWVKEYSYSKKQLLDLKPGHALIESHVVYYYIRTVEYILYMAVIHR